LCHVVSRSSAESKYKATVDLTRELVWIQDILTEMGFVPKTLMRLYYDNKSSNYIVQNLVFYEDEAY